jgi:hypothetical protein
MSEIDKVTKLCGPYPDTFESIDISSDPNFIFVNDPNFQAVKLYDQEENTVFVNSFTECQHYVKGGWSFIPELRNEDFYLDILSIFSIASVLFVLLVKSKIGYSFYEK